MSYDFNISIRDMLEAGCHFGHQTRYWNTKMSPYIYGARNNIHIINLEKTIVMYRQALRFIRKLVSNRGVILFVGTKRAAIDIIQSESKRCSMPYVNHRWLGGMLTNFKTVRQSIKKLQNMEADVVAGLYEQLSKKEMLTHEKKLDKLRRGLSGIATMNTLPSALFIVDVGYHDIALAEANKLGIPVIALVDTNNSPDGVDYIIPSNDDSSRALRLCTRGIADAILLGKADLVAQNHQSLEGKELVNENEVAPTIVTGIDDLSFQDPEAKTSSSDEKLS